MEPELEVLILSTEAEASQALEQWVREMPRPSRCRTVPGPLAPAAFIDPPPEVVVLAPRTWEEMSRWAEPLLERFAARPWLLLADPRIAGLFLTVLEQPLHCAILSAPGTSGEFRAAFESLVNGAPARTPAMLLEQVNAAFSARGGRHGVNLTRRELQCACACALGFTNREIASVLGVREGTVKQQLYGLLRKLGLETRREVAIALDEALFPGSAPP